MASPRDLDATISTLQGGVTSLSPGITVADIDGWIDTLQGAGLPQLTDILSELRRELRSGSFSVARVGPLFTQLGRQTETAASGADPEVAGKLQHLASLLIQIGGTIMSPPPYRHMDMLHA